MDKMSAKDTEIALDQACERIYEQRTTMDAQQALIDELVEGLKMMIRCEDNDCESCKRELEPLITKAERKE